MQFADFVVSSALQSLSRSLLKISEHDGPYHCGDDKVLLLTAERLLSNWQMVQWSIGRLQFEHARQDLKEVVHSCTSSRKPEVLAAERLLEKAEPKAARILGEIISGLAQGPGSDVSRERLSTLLQAESRRWREYGSLRQIDRSDLVEHGMLRAFRKARELSGKLDAMAQEGRQRASTKRLLRTGRWVRHCVNHLELLRPALSEPGRTRRWHLNRLAAKLEEQWALERFARLAVVIDLKPKASIRLEKLVNEERRRLDKQRRKLSIGAFGGGAKEYVKEVGIAVDQLGLESITLLPLEGADERRLVP